MPPVGLLAIVALGLVLAYALPQRVREREDFAMVRTEDRYSADMRVIRASARRAEAATRRASTDGEGVPLLSTGPARAKLAALGDGTMHRPSAPIDRAVTVAEREALALRRARAAAARQRRAATRRRGLVAVFAFLTAIAAWAAFATIAVSAWIPVLATTAMLMLTVAGRRAAVAQSRADRRSAPVRREVVSAAAGAQALRRLQESRAAGRPLAPSLVETQAIRVLTSEEAAPAAVDSEKVAADVRAAARASREQAEARRAPAEAWTPGAVPAPSYTLKAEAPRRVARPITDEDLELAQLNLARAAQPHVTGEAERARANEDRESGTAALDKILAKRRRSA